MGASVKRLYRYRVGQRRVIDHFFKDEDNKMLSILDIGCGIGTGMLHFKSLGFHDVTGIDNDPCRIELARRRKLNVFQMDMMEIYNLGRKFDVIWSSHSLEHYIHPDRLLFRLKNITTDNALFYFILPYPDLHPAELHVGSKIIGLDKNDEANSVLDWFELQGFEFIYLGFDDFREPEIWLELEKI